jgi:cyclophilin family peptidyl-prolyl cis-trans isomerase
MPVLHWLRSALSTITPQTKRNRRRGLAVQRGLTAADSLEARVLLSATALGDIPDVRFSAAGETTTIELSAYFDDTALTGGLVKVQTDQGAFYVETYDTITPITAANFLSLVTGGNYTDMFFHRSVPGFVIQGGGFTFPETSDVTVNVTNNGTIANEFANWFDPELGGLATGDPVNLRGTISMAKLGGNPDSATSQWFISVADNQSILDPQNGGFTVFAHVLFDGMGVVDQLVALEIANAGGAFAELPVVNLDPAATSIGRENLVFATPTIVEELQYSTTTSDLVTAEIVDGKLTLTATSLGAAQGGTVPISVTATDLQGTQVTSVIDVVLSEITITGPTGVTTSTPTMTWTPVATADSYDLRISRLDDRFPDVVQTANVVSQDAISGTSFTVTTALPDGQYSVSVSPRTGTVVGAASEGFVFYVGLEKPATPATPVVTPSTANELDVTFSWDALDDATHYDIWVALEGGDVVAREDWISGSSFVSPIQLQPGKAYRVWVRGRNVLQTGSWSLGTRYVGGSAVPGQPEITTASGSVSAVAESISWTTDPVATEYDVWIAADGVAAATRRITTTDTTALPVDLAEGFYRVWVRAGNGNGFGAWSRPASFGVAESGAKSAITGPTGNPIPVQPTITWSTGVPGLNYQLWANKVGGPSAVVNERNVTTTLFTPATDFAEGAYVAWVRQVSSTGAGLAWSSAFRFEVGASSAPEQPTLTVDSSNGTQSFSWAAVTNAVRYELWVNVGSSRVLHEPDLTSLSHTTTALTTGAHRAWLRGYSSLGVAGPWSLVVGFDV